VPLRARKPPKRKRRRKRKSQRPRLRKRRKRRRRSDFIEVLLINITRGFNEYNNHDAITISPFNFNMSPTTYGSCLISNCRDLFLSKTTL
jgi:hypothetical protein